MYLNTSNQIREEYFRLLFSLDLIAEENKKKLRELKREFLPSSLFRFRPVDDKSLNRRLDEIEKGEVMLVIPDMLNDPFECLFAFDKSKVQKSFIDAGRKRSAENNPGMDPKIFEKAFAKRKKQGDQMLEKMLPKIMKNIANTVLICSFSEDKNSMPMWSHYASNHKGLCLEYDMSVLREDAAFMECMCPIEYKDERIDATEHIIEAIRYESYGGKYKKEWVSAGMKAASRKDPNWQYEREWRLIYFSNIFWDQPDLSKKICTIDRPRKIYLGAKILRCHEMAIRDVCHKWDIEVVKMTPAYDRFLMEEIK